MHTTTTTWPRARTCANCAGSKVYPSYAPSVFMISCPVNGGMLSPISMAALNKVHDEITLPCFRK